MHIGQESNCDDAMVRSGLILVDVANYDSILFNITNFQRQFGDSAML